MSADLLVYVTRRVDRAMLVDALVALEAPCDAPEGEPEAWSGYMPVVLNLPGLEGEAVLGFDGSWHSGGSSKIRRKPVIGGYTLSYRGQGDLFSDEETVAKTFAVALAHAGEGEVHDPQEDKNPTLRALEKIVKKWRVKVERAFGKLSPRERAERQKQPGESSIEHRDRLWIRNADDAEIIDRLRDALPAEIKAGNDRAMDWLATHAPTTAGFIEPFLDPCFRAQRLDLAARFAARFSTSDLQKHLEEARRWEGVAAAPYANFVAQVLERLPLSASPPTRARNERSETALKRENEDQRRFEQGEASRQEWNVLTSAAQNILGRRVSLGGFEEGNWQVFLDAIPSDPDYRLAYAVQVCAADRSEVEARQMLEALPCALLTTPVSEADARYVGEKLEILGARVSVRQV